MIPFEEMDARLAAIGKSRAWLSEVTPYKANSIRQALGPAGGARSERLQEVLSRAIEDEETKQAGPKMRPGFHEIFLTDEQLDRADRASRVVNAASLADFCRDAIMMRADELLETKRQPLRVVADDVAEYKASYWLDMVGGVAAGAVISSDCMMEPVRVEKYYDPATHRVRKVFGESMLPKIPDESLIVERVVTNGETPRKGTIVIYEDAHGATLKVFDYRKAQAGEEGDAMGNVPVLRSLNKAFKDVQTLEGGRISGVFVEVV